MQEPQKQAVRTPGTSAIFDILPSLVKDENGAHILQQQLPPTCGE